jgi:uncharacterized membrane protein
MFPSTDNPVQIFFAPEIIRKIPLWIVSFDVNSYWMHISPIHHRVRQIDRVAILTAFIQVVSLAAIVVRDYYLSVLNKCFPSVIVLLHRDLLS